MKTIFRILVILVVANLMGAVIFTAVNGIGSPTSEPQDFAGNRPPERENDRDERSGGLALLFSMAQTLTVISIIAAIYFNINKEFTKRKKIIQQSIT